MVRVKETGFVLKLEHTLPAGPVHTDQLLMGHWQRFRYEFLYNYVVYQLLPGKYKQHLD